MSLAGRCFSLPIWSRGWHGVALRGRPGRNLKCCRVLISPRVSAVLVSTVQAADPLDEQSIHDTVEKPPSYKPWRVVAAVCLQRFPTLSLLSSPLAAKMETLKDVQRVERSRRSDFELEEAEYLRKKRERERRALEEDPDETQLKRIDTSDEFEELQEARVAELAAFKPASRETEADVNRDTKSTQRRLDRTLYLLVKKPRTEHAWQMPQGGLEGSESLVEAASRELSEECGGDLKVEFLSSAPAAFISYRHSTQTSEPSEIVGSKVFFLKAQLAGGSVSVDGRELEDHLWLTKEEMKDYVSQDYYKAVAPMLMH